MQAPRIEIQELSNNFFFSRPRYYFVVVGRNGHPVMSSWQTYSRKRDAVRAIRTVLHDWLAFNAPVYDVSDEQVGPVYVDL